MQRTCQQCDKTFEAQRSTAKFCGSTCRANKHQGKSPASAAHPPTAPGTDVVDALHAELQKLGLASSYEAVVALKIARQLDNGTVTGAAVTSLSKELDRRVDALRLKAVLPDDPTVLITARLEEKQAHLRAV